MRQLDSDSGMRLVDSCNTLALVGAMSSMSHIRLILCVRGRQRTILGILQW